MKKILKMFLCMFVILSNMTLVDVKAESSSKIGDVVLEGDDQFDCDELFTEDSYDWNWLSTIGSRTVLLPSQNLNNKDFSLDFDLFVNKDDKKIRNFEKVKLGQDENSLKVANNLDYQWTPYCIKYNGTYDKGQTIKMTEFYNDKNTFVRLYDISNADGNIIQMSYKGEFNHGNTQDEVIIKKLEDNSILLEGPDFYFLVKMMLLNEDTTVNKLLSPEINGKEYSFNIPVSTNKMKVATSVTLAVKPDDKSSGTVIERAKTIVDGKISDKLAATKDMWDEKLSNIPKPTVWGIQEVSDNKGVTEVQHQQSFYAAWTFNYQNIMEPVHENGFNHYQVTLGKPSGYTSGPDGAINSCAWESLFCIQQLSMIEPEIAWDAMLGFIESIPSSGKLSGESLPSQKAHTVWVCYENYKDQKDGLIEELKDIYPKLKAYLKWRADNPRWIMGGNDIYDEKDISFVTQWYSDVNYVIKICHEIGQTEDIAMWEQMKETMAENAREWFFQEDGKIYNWYFTDKKTHYYDYRKVENEYVNYSVSALNADLPEDLMDKVVDFFIKEVYKEDEDLLGFDFYKYGDGCQIAYGLFEKEHNYPELENMWKKLNNVILRHVIKTGEFSEECKPNEYKVSGVAPSTFTASAVIDFTYMNNGIRIDEGKPMVFSDIDTQYTLKEDNLEYATLKGNEITLPESIKVSNGTEEFDAYVIWDLTEVNKDKAGDYKVLGKVSVSDLTVNATVHVYDGNLTYDSIQVQTVANTKPQLPNTISVRYVINGKTYYGYTYVKWDEIDESQLVLGATLDVKGTLQVNNQEIKAKITVSDLSIISENGSFEVDKGESLQLSVKNKDNNVVNVKQWSIEDSNNNNVFGINEKGKLIGISEGTQTVTALLEDGLLLKQKIKVNEKNMVSLSYQSIVRADSEKEPATNAIDLNQSTMWRSEHTNPNQKFEIKLNHISQLTGLNILWYQETQPKHFKIETSQNGSEWEQVYERQNSINDKGKNYSDTIVFEEEKEAQFIRIYIYETGAFTPGIVELEIFGKVKDTLPATNISLKTATGTFEILDKASELQMIADLEPTDIKDKRIIWEIHDKGATTNNIARITADGKVIPLKNGAVEVSATSATNPNLKETVEIIIKNQDLMNVALNQKVIATTEDSTNIAENAVDGSMDTRWGSVSGAPQDSHFTICFDQSYEIVSTKLNFESAKPIDYKIQYSNSPFNIDYDDIDWIDLEVITDNQSQQVMYNFNEPVVANYARIISSKTSNAEWGYSIFEFEVYGKEASKIPVEKIEIKSPLENNKITKKNQNVQMTANIYPNNATNQNIEWSVWNLDDTETTKAIITNEGLLTAKENGSVKVVAKAKDGSSVQDQVIMEIENQDLLNVALNKEVIASTDKNDNGTSKDFVVDGDKNTRWSSDYNDDEYIIIDLKDIYYINQVVLNWETSFGKEYKLLGSIDGQTYSELYHESNSDGGIDDINLDLTLVRYVKLQGIQRSSEYGYSLWEFEVYGKALKEDLRILYDAVKDTDEALYTPKSFEAFKKALDTAKAVLEKEEVTEQEVKEAYDALTAANEQLQYKADKTYLKTQLDKAHTLKESEYTPNSYAQFKEVLSNAQKVYDNENATQEEVQDAEKTLKDAIENLVLKADKTELGKLIEKAKGINSKDYTPETFKALNEALNIAQKVYDNENATQKEVQEAEKTLKDAIENLVLKADKTELGKLIEKAKGINSKDYTPETFKALNEALNIAQKVYDNENATQKEVQEAEKTLKDAIENLVLKANKTDLGDLIKKAKGLNSKDYTPETFKTLNEALIEAQKTYDNEKATQEEVQKVYVQLKDAYDGLKKVEVNESGNPVIPSNPNDSNKPLKPSDSIQTDSENRNVNGDTVDTSDSSIIIPGIIAIAISGLVILKLKRNKKAFLKNKV